MQYTEQEILDVYNQYSDKDLNVFLMLSTLKAFGASDFYLKKWFKGAAWLFFGLLFTSMLIAGIVLVVTKQDIKTGLILICIDAVYAIISVVMASIDMVRAWSEYFYDADGKKLMKAQDRNNLLKMLEEARKQEKAQKDTKSTEKVTK